MLHHSKVDKSENTVYIQMSSVHTSHFTFTFTFQFSIHTETPRQNFLLNN